MKKFISLVYLFGFLGVMGVSIVEANEELDYVTPKEVCGTISTQKKYEFYHRGQFLSDLVRLVFNDDGGFTLYNEENTNHEWEVDPDAYTIIKKVLTTGSRSFVTYNLDTHARNISGNTTATTNDWTFGFSDILHDITRQENFITQSNSPLPRVKVALNCAQKILVNTLARGQERLFKGKTNTKF